jgi:hypothetical protein
MPTSGCYDALVVPVIFYLLVALTVGMNIGVRHILLVYVFL